MQSHKEATENGFVGNAYDWEKTIFILPHVMPNYSSSQEGD
jgi:hypothetical protein